MFVVGSLVARLCSALHVSQFIKSSQEHRGICNQKGWDASGEMKAISEQEMGQGVSLLSSIPSSPLVPL